MSPVQRARVLLLSVSAVVVLLAGIGAAFALAGRVAKAPTTVNVTMRDYLFVLSRRSVPAGRVRFVVVNKGATVHDFAVGRAKTRLLKPGGRQTLVVTFARAARVSYRCTVAGHAALGMKGTLIVGKPKAPPPSTTTTTAAPSVDLQLTPLGTFARPDLVTSPPGDQKRVFVVEQGGVIRVVDDGVLQETPFLDISDAVQFANETGLLGLAFAPDYETSGLFYVDYTRHEGNGNIYVEEFRRSTTNPDVADPESERVVLRIVKPWENHNAGMLQFGPDGYLYIAVGDGDSGVLNPPGAFAQTLDDLLGNILRIDPREQAGAAYTVPATNPFVGVDGELPEIWAYGLRNPWRFWIDPASGDMVLGDVGEGQEEELDYVPAGTGGLNFGWPCLEGTAPLDTQRSCPGAVAPILWYTHQTDRCAVIAGVTVHDTRLPALDGLFLYSDLCGGEVEAVRLVSGTVAEQRDLMLNVPGIDSFGVDGRGSVYAISFDGPVYRIDPPAS